MKYLSIMFIFLVFVLQGCACERVTQGHTGLMVANYGDEKGGITEVGPGRHHYNPWTTDFYSYPNYVQRIAWDADLDDTGAEDGEGKNESIKVLSGDQLEFTLDVGFAYFVNSSAGCSAALFQKYRKSVEDLTRGPLRDIVRNEVQGVFSKHPASYIYGEGRGEIVRLIQQGVQSRLSDVESEGGETCFVIEEFALLKLDPPNSVKQAVELKVRAAQEAQQKREELLSARYDAEKDSIRAVMAARNNNVLSQSITPALIEYERLQLMKERWDGSLPQVMGGDSDLLLGINP